MAPAPQRTPLLAAGRIEKLAVAAAILFFIGLASLWIDRPGLHYDESLFVTAAYPNAQRGGVGYVEVFGHRVNLMALPYLGALKGWIYRPIFDLVGPSAASMRVPVILLGALTLLLVFLLARKAFDAKAGLFSVALLASDPAFLFTTRLDWGPVVIQRLCLVAGCLLLLRFREKAAPQRLFAAFFVFGVGLYDKLTFAWLLAALAIAAAILYPRQLAAYLNPRNIVIALAAFLLGSLPFVLYRLTTPAALGLRLESNPRLYFAKLSMLYHSLDGTIFQGWFANVTAPKPISLATLPSFARYWLERDALLDPNWIPWALLASLLALPWTLKTPQRRGLLFTLLFSVFAVALMIPVKSAGSAHHLTLIYPFPQIFIAATLSIAARRLNRTAIAATVCLLFLTNVRTTVEQYGQILRFGGTPPWSEAICPLYDFLKTANASGIVVLDWGIAMQLRLLSGDQLPLKETPREENYFIEAVELGLQQPRPLFVTYDLTVPVARQRTRELLQQSANTAGRPLRSAAVIEDYHGRPMYEIFELDTPPLTPGITGKAEPKR